MGVIFIVVAGFVIFVLSLFSIVEMITNRVTTPTIILKDEVENLERRVNELESENS